MTEKWQCPECGVIRINMESITAHMVVKHADFLVEKTVIEAIEIAELERMFSK